MNLYSQYTAVGEEQTQLENSPASTRDHWAAQQRQY